MKSSFALSLFAVLLFGCGQEEVKSADWWRDHPKEATEKYIACKASGEETQNCINVKAISGSLYNYPPMKEIIKEEADEIRRKLAEGVN